MKFISGSICIFLLVSILYMPGVAAYTDLQHTYITLMLSDRDYDVKTGVKGIYDDFSSDLEMVDIVAELLWEYDKGGADFDTDTVGWMMRAIGESGFVRYKPLLDDFRRNITERKIKKWMKLTQENLNKSSDGEFIPGKLDRNGLLKELDEQKHNDSRKGNNSNVGNIQLLDTIDMIYSELGLPDSVTTKENISEKNVGLGIAMKVTFVSSSIRFVYDDIGSIDVARSDDDALRIAHIAKHASVLMKALEVDPEDRVSYGLAYGDPMFIEDLFKYVRDGKNSGSRHMDVLATRLWNNSSAQNKLSIRQERYITDYFSGKKNKRYYNFFSEYAIKVNHDKKLAILAQRVAKSIGNSDVEQFQPMIFDKSNDPGFLRNATLVIRKTNLIEGEKYALLGISRDLRGNKVYDPEVLDIAAERLWKERATTDRSMESALTYLVRLLGESGNSKYRTLLEKIAAGRVSSRFKNHLDIALAELPLDNAGQFVPEGGW